MNSILVHGASGFIGANLAHQIALSGHRVVLVDRRLPAPELRGFGTNVCIVRADRLSDVLGIPEPRVVFSVAGATSVDAALANPAVAVRDNLEIAQDLGECMRTRWPHARLVYMSSDEVLGAAVAPLDESSPLSPTQPYAASKAAAEILLGTYRSVYGLDISMVRSCNIVGRWQRLPKLLPAVVDALMNDRPVRVHGSGNQRREWMSVQDLCHALLVVAEVAEPAPVYHASTGTSLSVMDVIEVAARALGLKARLEHVADRIVQDVSYAMSCERLAAIGWRPDVEAPIAIAQAAVDLSRGLPTARQVSSMSDTAATGV